MLEVDRLERSYGAVRALDGMTFTVRPGAVTGFLGPNGAGKTTTMRAVFDLTAVDAGEVRWDGRPLDHERRRQFGYLPEERGLYPSMRVIDQLQYLGRLHGLGKADARSRAQEWLDRLGLGDRSASNLEDLSLGNQQRVQLIGALVHRPDVLVLDEPFSGLDPVAVDSLSRVLVDEARRGATVLFSSHQLDLVEDLCDDAIIVDRGRAVTQGSLDELTAGHDPVLVVAVDGDRDAAWTDQLSSGAVGGFTVLSRTGGEARIAVSEGPGTVVERAQVALDVARGAGPVHRFGLERRSLAEVFLETVGRSADDASPHADSPPQAHGDGAPDAST